MWQPGVQTKKRAGEREHGIQEKQAKRQKRASELENQRISELKAFLDRTQKLIIVLPVRQVQGRLGGQSKSAFILSSRLILSFLARHSSQLQNARQPRLP